MRGVSPDGYTESMVISSFVGTCVAAVSERPYRVSCVAKRLIGLLFSGVRT
jgi:hypothetical protein